MTLYDWLSIASRCLSYSLLVCEEDTFHVSFPIFSSTVSNRGNYCTYVFFCFCFLRSIWSSCWLPWHHLAYFAHLSPSEAWSVETFPPGNGRKHIATHWGGGGEESTNWIDSTAWKKPRDDELDDCWQLLAPGRESLLDLLAWLCLVYLQAICTWDFLALLIE